MMLMKSLEGVKDVVCCERVSRQLALLVRPDEHDQFRLLYVCMQYVRISQSPACMVLVDARWAKVSTKSSLPRTHIPQITLNPKLGP